MAGVIVLDASTLIAHFDPADVHHEAASALLRAHPDDGYLLHTLTLTEVLVGPVRAGREDFVLRQLDAMGIAEWVPSSSSALHLARLRAQTRLRLPGCCVLLPALVNDAELATFDERLAGAATTLGIPVVSLGAGAETAS